MTAHRGRHNHLWRRLAQGALDVVLGGGVLARLSYRCGLHGRLGVTRVALALPAERRLPHPLTIAFASDFHAGLSTHPALFSSLFDALAQHAPDLLLLGGDFVSGKADHLLHLLAGFEGCNPRLGKYAVFGNHDLWVDDQQMTRALAGVGVQTLVNRNVALPAPFDAVSICGMDDPWTGDADGQLTFAGAQRTRILLMHAPDGLLLLGGEQFDVGFAGHTHGGQIAFPDGTPIIVPHGPLSRKYCYGSFEVENNGSMIVSRGVGCSSLPVRINAEPELVLCTLV
jgi:uncharacterized protein